MRVVGLAAGSAMVAAALLLGSGTATAATGADAPVASSVSAEGGTGSGPCAQLPASLQELLCPSPDGAAEQASAGGSSATGGTGSGSASTGGTAGTAPASGTPAPSPTTPPGVVSNFLIWLAGLFQAAGL